MSKRTRSIDTLYYLTHLLDEVEQLTERELNELANSSVLKSLSSNSLERMYMLLWSREGYQTTNQSNGDRFEAFKFDLIMQKLRNTVMHKSSQSDNVSEIDWLLRILLVSPQIFESVRELNNFLINMTGMFHDTKSTGRDRIVDWYLKAIRDLPQQEQNRIYHKIATYIFIEMPSNYKEWKKILYKDGK
ncbi:hypothetical protein ACQKFM_21140 [Paenibacillus xylanexedens]|uniref:hypothetical protein n=1 Tax=Paenibacillus xylanexedens TaxID=528191 RepID=UPI003D09338F